MNTWWLAVDTAHTSYASLRRRHVVAQGWPQIGDLRTIVPLAGQKSTERLFRSVVTELAKRVYRPRDRDIDRAPEAMWSLLQVRTGDLVVAIEGTSVCGVCQVGAAATDSYLFDASEPTEYKQTVCSLVDWLDWDKAKLGVPPTPPAQSVMAIKRLKKDSDLVVAAWAKARG